ncbi:MAG: class I SAM-dependent methyltransferase [Actinomycetota bacterium]|nr:class I SAM-dependent methyltransferase [Actinomycetota bacterium]
MLTVELGRAGIAPGARVLDLGCGGGRHAFAVARAGADVVALDADASECSGVAGMLAAMRSEGEVASGTRAGVVRADALRLPFPDSSFDRVVAAEVLEHVRDDRAAIAELARVLRPGGVLAVSVPRLWPEALNWALSAQYRTSPGGHVRIYRRSELRRRVCAAGMVPVATHHAHALHSPYWWLRCLVGVDRPDHPLVAAFHELLVWEMTASPRSMRVLERLLRPLLGKSLVAYYRREGAAPAR